MRLRIHVGRLFAETPGGYLSAAQFEATVDVIDEDGKVVGVTSVELTGKIGNKDCAGSYPVQREFDVVKTPDP